MTKYGMCPLSCIPVRKQPSDKSEMVNQLLAGELVIIIEEKDSWLLTRSSHDNYEGWVDKKQISEISEEEYTTLSNTKQPTINDLVVVSRSEDGSNLILPIGCRLPEYVNSKFKIAGKSYNIDKHFVIENEQNNSIKDTALKFLNCPYLWGGRSSTGIDCSGLVQVVYAINGKQLPRDSSQQAEIGRTIDFIEEAKEGDLAFFDNSEHKITHVGIMLSNNKIIHASGCVRIDEIDHNGIYNAKDKKYSHKLRIIKRVLD